MIIDQIRYKCRQKNDLSSEAILVFLPGLNEIENFSEDVFKFLGGREKVFNEFELIHVHSTIMTEAIENKINTPSKRQIKLIISTNIAESSITVKGVKYVIDFCLTKEIRYDGKSRMENLELVYSSRASCKQRAGRTGRVCDGYIFRMVEKKFYDEKFEDYSEPEIKRSSLDKLILRIKLMHEKDSKNLFADPPEVLGTCIQPPRLESIQSAIDSLKFCGGL
jgi:ATP-dependent RNA helicase TDRD9